MKPSTAIHKLNYYAFNCTLLALTSVIMRKGDNNINIFYHIALPSVSY